MSQAGEAPIGTRPASLQDKAQLSLQLSHQSLKLSILQILESLNPELRISFILKALGAISTETSGHRVRAGR